MNDFARSTYEVARKEVLQHIRTKRLLIIAGLIVLSLVLLTIVFGPDIARGMDLEVVATENFVLLVYFSTFFIGGYFFLQLLAIVLTADAVCSEWSNKTLFLLLSKPVSRLAFVTGKFLGSYVSVSVTMVVLIGLDYLAIQGGYAGSPTGKEVLGFFGALGILVLGAAAYTSMALFFSTITRSTVMALLFTLGMWIIILPLLGQIGFFIELGNEQPDPNSDLAEGFRYLNPHNDMATAGKLLVSNNEVREVLDALSQSVDSVPLAVFALLVHTVVWFGLSAVVVLNRNFE
jgi:ABC-type transport system involved in multi-copper enzyme maturation permease subunit